MTTTLSWPERYGWVNRTLPAVQLNDFVSSLAHRIAKFPAAGRAVVKDRVNDITLASVDEIRRDSDLFLKGSITEEFRRITTAAVGHGFQTNKGELDLARMMADL